MPLKFGVAGTGHWADTVHIPGLKTQPAVELVGVWGRSPEALKSVARHHGIRAFARFEDMLDQVDAVSFSLPPAVQAELAVVAADAGKHLLLEKPIASTVDAAERVVAAADRNQIATVVFFTRRFVPEFEQSLEAARRRPSTGALIRQHTGALLPGSPFAGSVWRQAEDGALWDLGPHVLAAVTAVLGPIERVSASRSSDRMTRFTATHRGGAQSAVSLSLHTPPSDLVSEYLFHATEGDFVLPQPAFPRPEALATTAGELAANVARGERRHRCDVRLGLEVVRVLAAADRSIATGAAVTL